MNKLCNDILGRFMGRFMGYGSYGSSTRSVWLVGMEEGGGGTVCKVRRRLEVWQEGDEPELEDLRLAHERRGEPERFVERCRLQPTWAKLIRFLLARGGTSGVTTEEVRSYQRSHLGRLDGDHCMLELLPLPARSRAQRDWHYDQWTELQVLRNRALYEDEVGRRRVGILKTKLMNLQPAFVLFYGLGHRKFWESIAGSAFEPVSFEHQTFQFAKVGKIRCAVLPHPTAHGATNALFESVGRFAAESR